MTSLASVILEPFGPERASRAGSAKGKNLSPVSHWLASLKLTHYPWVGSGCVTLNNGRSLNLPSLR